MHGSEIRVYVPIGPLPTTGTDMSGCNGLAVTRSTWLVLVNLLLTLLSLEVSVTIPGFPTKSI